MFAAGLCKMDLHPFWVENIPFGWDREPVCILGETESTVLRVTPRTKLRAHLLERGG